MHGAFRVEGPHRRRYCRVSATTMDTRCHPAPPRRSACPRTRGDDVARHAHRVRVGGRTDRVRVDGTARRLRALLGVVIVGVALMLAAVASPARAGDDVANLVDDALALCAAADRVAPDARMPLLA